MNTALQIQAPESTETTEFGRVTIRTERVAEASYKIRKMQKKAKKFGQAGIQFSFENERVGIVKHTNEAGDTFEEEVSYTDIVVVGLLPKMEGYTFVARIEQEQGQILFKCAPGQEGVLQWYQNKKDFNANECAHCNKDRSRKHTFVLRHDDGNYIQVGRNCLADFVRGTDPASILAHLKFVQTISDNMREFDGMRTAIYPIAFTVSVLEYACADVRERGYRKAGFEGESTRYMVGNVYQPDKKSQKSMSDYNHLSNAVTDADRAQALEIIEWSKTLPDNSEYIHNLKALLSMQVVPNFFRNLGIVVSAVQAWLKAKDLYVAKERAAALPPSQYIGVVGERQRDVTLTLKRKINLGTCNFTGGSIVLHVFNDTNNNVITWITTSAPRMDIDKSFVADFTVKKHKLYEPNQEKYPDGKPIEQTEINRLKVK